MLFLAQAPPPPERDLPGCKLEFSVKADAGPAPSWFAEVERQTQDWFRHHPQEWRRLPFADYRVGLRFERGWPRREDVAEAAYRRGRFVSITIRGEGGGAEARETTRAYVWGDGGWIHREGRAPRTVALERGVTVYVEKSLHAFCRSFRAKPAGANPDGVKPTGGG